MYKDSLVADELQQHFDFHSLVAHCGSLLSIFKSQFEPTTSERRRNTGRDEDFTVVEMVDEVLWEAADMEKANRRLLKGTVLGAIAACIQEIINNESSTCLKRARKALEIDHQFSAFKPDKRASPISAEIIEGMNLTFRGEESSSRAYGRHGQRENVSRRDQEPM